jgi:hypothetical protein
MAFQVYSGLFYLFFSIAGAGGVARSGLPQEEGEGRADVSDIGIGYAAVRPRCGVSRSFREIDWWGRAGQ